MATYNRALDVSSWKVPMANWALSNMRYDRGEIFSDWESKGYGEFTISRNEFGEEFSYFELSEKGKKRGKKIIRRSSIRRLIKTTWSAVISLSPFVAAVAASAAAYFSYLNLQGQ